VFKNALGNFWRFAGFLSIEAPHDALQAGHFHHHLAGKVCLAKLSHALGSELIRLGQPQIRAKFLAQFLDSPGFREHRSELLLEGQLL